MCKTPINWPDQSNRLNQEKLTVLAHCSSGVNQPRADRHDDEAFVLQLDRPLRRRHERSGFGNAVCRRAGVGNLPHKPRVSAGRADDDNLLRAPGAKQRQECGDAMNHAERIDLELE